METQEREVGIRGEDQGGLALDVIPDSSSPGVREWLKQLPRLFMARQILLTLGVVGRYQYIATNASAKEASVLVKTQNGLFSVLKSIDATSLMLQSFQSGANNILEKLKVAYLYLLDGFPDFAKTDIDAIAKDIKTMKESTEKALVVIRKTATNIEEAHKLVSEKNGREGRLAKIQQTIAKLNDEYRGLSEGQMGGLGGEATRDTSPKNDSGLRQSRNILDFLKVKFLKEPMSLLRTFAVLASLCVCNCGWVTMILVMVLFMFGLVMMKLGQPRHNNFKSVIPLILVGIFLVHLPCQLLFPSCEFLPCQLLFPSCEDIGVVRPYPPFRFPPFSSIKIEEAFTTGFNHTANNSGCRSCVKRGSVVFMLTPLLTFLVLMLCYYFAPERWFIYDSVSHPTGRKDESGLNQRPTFLDFLKINTIAFLKDPVSLVMTVAVFVSFHVCDCYFYNSICGWATMILAMAIFLIRFGLRKLVQLVEIISIILAGLAPFLCVYYQFAPPCLLQCFLLSSLLTIFELFVCYYRVPEHWFFKVKDSDSLPSVCYNTDPNKGSTESPVEQRQRIKDERLEASAEKQRIEESIGDADLTKCFLGKALSDLKSVTGIIQQSTAVIERWYKECKDIIEPSMDRTIQKAQSVPEGELRNYWNSMAFKNEVVGYYCRWRALQVYCETLRSECREKRATLESHYVENLYPRDAVVRAWELAHEEAADPEVARLVREHKQRMRDGNGHDLTNLVNSRNKEVRLNMPQ